MSGMKDLTCRPASAEDLGTLQKMYGELDPARGEPELARLEEVWREVEANRSTTVWIAILDGEAAGSFVLAIIPALGARCRPIAIVEDVVVRPESRGLGIGRTMMRFAMEKAREAGAYKLMLSSNLQREDAHRFYDRLGFERHGYSFVVEL